MNNCHFTDLGSFESCDPIDLSGYAPLRVQNYVTRFDCVFTLEEADSINLAPGTYWFVDDEITYKFTVV